MSNGVPYLTLDPTCSDQSFLSCVSTSLDKVQKSLADQQIDKKFTEILDSRKITEIVENNKFLEISSAKNAPQKQSTQIPANKSAVASLKMKIKRKKLNDKQADFGSNFAKKKCLVAAKNPSVVLEKIDTQKNIAQLEASKDFHMKTTSVLSSAERQDFNRRDVGTWVRTVAGGADAESLGSCEPGTAITLDGVVWQETSTGLLVVNVTWRGKSYIGTLLDSSKSDWSAPRFCDSPNETNIDGSKSNIKGRNLKRNSSSNSAQISSLKNGSIPNENTTKMGSLKDQLENKKIAFKSTNQNSSNQITDFVLEPSSPLLFQCPLSGCEKKFSQIVALTYHQNSTHKFLAETRKDASTLTDPLVVIVETAPDRKEPSLCKIDQLKQLSEAEHESLENLFKVVKSSSISHTDDHQPKQSTYNALRSIARTPPVLHTPDDVAHSTLSGELLINAQSPAAVFSDVSDVEDEDEAPTLERHNLPTTATPRLPSISSKSPASSSRNLGGKRNVALDRRRCDDVATSFDKKITKPLLAAPAVRPPSIKVEPMASPVPPIFTKPPDVQLSQSSHTPPRPLLSTSATTAHCLRNNGDGVTYTEASFARSFDENPASSVVPFFVLPPSMAMASTPSGLPPSCYNPGGPPLPMSFLTAPSTHPPPHLGTYPLPAFPMLAPRAPHFESVVSPTSMVTSYCPSVASPPNFFVPQAHFATSHKIHELSSVRKSTPKLSQLPPTQKCRSLPFSHVKEPSVSMLADSPVNVAINVVQLPSSPLASASPPVQRHHHLHHHTHSYPLAMMAPDPFSALYPGGPQAAPASILGTYPAYSRK